jgi:hypothetical protein
MGAISSSKNNNNNNNNLILYYLCAESTVARPVTDTAQCIQVITLWSNKT